MVYRSCQTTHSSSLQSTRTTLQNKLEGHNLDGSVINHDQLPGAIADLQSTYDRMKGAPNADPAVLNQLKSTIGSMQAKLEYFDIT